METLNLYIEPIIALVLTLASLVFFGKAIPRVVEFAFNRASKISAWFIFTLTIGLYVLWLYLIYLLFL